MACHAPVKLVPAVPPTGFRAGPRDGDNGAMDRSAQLSDFLRSRRGRLQPADVGLPARPDGRRTSGLRRAELAVVAGISVDYYTRLEQGRAGNVSAQVLDALARALGLDELERAHLHALAQPPGSAAAERLALLSSWDPAPAAA